MANHIIVLGNEKGGSGKTTTAMHLIISLLKLGFSVASIDIDSRQQSLTRYVDNRKQTAHKHGWDLDLPEHIVINKSREVDINLASRQEEEQFLKEIERLKNNHDFVVIDTPGSDSLLSRLSHSMADTIITPINDSFIDVDLLGKVSADNFEVVTPGIYSAMLWEQKLKRAARDKGEINWFVIRNRLATLDTINQRNIEVALNKLAKKFGFTIAPGFSDRVIFKELFLHGLTLHDTDNTLVRMNSSMLAARLEMRNFLKHLKIQEIGVKIDEKTAA